jgi:hypothetical protein
MIILISICLIAFILFIIYIFLNNGPYNQIPTKNTSINEDNNRLHILHEQVGAKATIIIKDREVLFTNHIYKINAYPDEIILNVNNEYVCVETKSRTKGIFQSDINQNLATILACRGDPKYKNLRKGIIHNQGNEIKEINLPENCTDSDIFKMIEKEYNILQKIISNHKMSAINNYQSLTNPKNCLHCTYTNTCVLKK